MCLAGPVSIFFNPIIHKSIITNESIFVNSNEALVVYQIHSDGEKDEASFNNLAAKDKALETGIILLIDKWQLQFFWNKQRLLILAHLKDLLSIH